MKNNEIEFVELEEELLPALTVGVRRLSDGVNALKIYLENISEQVSALREESAKLKQIVEEDKKILQEERNNLFKQFEKLINTFESILERLDRDVKTMLDLGLGGVGKRLEELESQLNVAWQEIQALRLENKNKFTEALNQILIVKGEVYALRSKLEDLTRLVYELELKSKQLEERIANDLAEIKLLLTDLSARTYARESTGMEEKVG